MKKKQDKKPVKKEQGKTEPENKLPPKQEKRITIIVFYI